MFPLKTLKLLRKRFVGKKRYFRGIRSFVENNKPLFVIHQLIMCVSEETNKPPVVVVCPPCSLGTFNLHRPILSIPSPPLLKLQIRRTPQLKSRDCPFLSCSFLLPSIVISLHGSKWGALPDSGGHFECSVDSMKIITRKDSVLLLQLLYKL